EFEGRRKEDPVSTLKVVGWGNLAGEMKESYHEGDRLIIEGRLSMNTFERKEGFKEKRAELVASHVYLVDSNGVASSGKSQEDDLIPFEKSPTSSDRDDSYDDNADQMTDSSTSETKDDNLDKIPF
ncbi:MAG: single-stranded DNA-binding protein, partial [Cyanobacteria bacterium P01_G01_bin.49]